MQCPTVNSGSAVTSTVWIAVPAGTNTTLKASTAGAGEGQKRHRVHLSKQVPGRLFVMQLCTGKLRCCVARRDKAHNGAQASTVPKHRSTECPYVCESHSKAIPFQMPLCWAVRVDLTLRFSGYPSASYSVDSKLCVDISTIEDRITSNRLERLLDDTIST